MKIDLKEKIRNIPDFPKPGIMFRDITTLLADHTAFSQVIKKFKKYCKTKEIDAVIGIESRGFIFGAALAHALGKSFVIVRKPGKLPYKKVSEEYELEYGKDKIEIHEDAIKAGQKVLIVDDLLATGGTSLAAAKLVEKLGGVVAGLAFVTELNYLKGREKIKAYKDFDVFSLVNYET